MMDGTREAFLCSPRASRACLKLPGHLPTASHPAPGTPILASLGAARALHRAAEWREAVRSFRSSQVSKRYSVPSSTKYIYALLTYQNVAL
jgi:hypothetical protein